MARITPDPAVATTVHTFRVRFCETDLMGIVHHANYLQDFEAGRVEWLGRRGILYSEWVGAGVHTAVVEALTKYHAPAKFDDELSCATTLAEVGGKGRLLPASWARGPRNTACLRRCALG